VIPAGADKKGGVPQQQQQQPSAVPAQPQPGSANKAEASTLVPTTDSSSGIAEGAHSPKRKQQKAPTLINAAKEGNCALIKTMLEAGSADGPVDINKTGMWGSTPLLCACQYKQEEAALALLQHGADPTVLNEKEASAILHTCMEDMQTALGSILEWAAANRETTLAHTVQQMVDGAPGCVYNTCTDTNCRLTPLLAASMNGNQEIVATLIGKGCDVNRAVVVNPKAKDIQMEDGSQNSEVGGMRPVMAAAREGHTAIVELLREAGASVTGADQETNDTPLTIACRRGHGQTAKKLIEFDASVVSQVSTDGMTALLAACKNAKTIGVAVVPALITAGAHVHACDKKGMSPLMFAVKAGIEPVVRALLEAGASPTEANLARKSARDLATQYGRKNILQLLEDCCGVSESEPDMKQPSNEAQSTSPVAEECTNEGVKSEGAKVHETNSASAPQESEKTFNDGESESNPASGLEMEETFKFEMPKKPKGKKKSKKRPKKAGTTLKPLQLKPNHDVQFGSGQPDVMMTPLKQPGPNAVESTEKPVASGNHETAESEN
jgi:ankyrin repeat protein